MRNQPRLRLRAAIMILLTALAAASIPARPAAPDQRGPAPVQPGTGPYLGQQPPGAEPVIFAPGIVSTGQEERDLTMTPDGREIYFCVILNQLFSKIVVVREEGGRWTSPEVAPFSTNPAWSDIEPFISPDGKKFFFVSNRPPSGTGPATKQYDIWVMDRQASAWGEPHLVEAPVQSEANEFFPSVTRDGTLYFCRRQQGEEADHIFRSRLVDGKYREPEKLGPEVNGGQAEFNACIAPDESFIIICIFGREDSIGATDYYISFRDHNDRWTGPFNLGPKINTPAGQEYSPAFSPDGRYFFFMTVRPLPGAPPPAAERSYRDLLNQLEQPGNGKPDIWWMEASFIEALRPKPEVKHE